LVGRMVEKWVEKKVGTMAGRSEMWWGKLRAGK
jgi:hypothetical protein